ncbi:methylosome subunit pICln [Tribolium castaneum]|uniref:Methylosome subunit pICln n=1 Tax=Tribolium castaneum TaxID=7070 RepID=D6WHX2_TRICA|nr:PREDICTED: methylosome subunit pICln [Tribolium castaneum]EFA00708.1 Methylosome subunit pICln-like Protein [Tribolium castaneum]|eukprot:XP_969465.1 PREDICTED: methylosome subunit pICln [Tribolium castaneum]
MVVVTSFKPPESPIRLEQSNVVVILDKRDLGTGTLFVSERTLSWQKDGTTGFSIEYYNVSLHAVSKDPNVCERECIYILTDPHINLFGETDQRPANDDSDVESEPDLSELILAPENPTHVQSIYEAIKICQELNPDPADVDDEDDDNLFADAEEEMFIEAESEQIGDAVVDSLAERLQNNSVDVQYSYRNGNEDEDFEDAD